jgi:hypothetical protein
LGEATELKLEKLYQELKEALGGRDITEAKKAKLKHLKVSGPYFPRQAGEAQPGASGGLG